MDALRTARASAKFLGIEHVVGELEGDGADEEGDADEEGGADDVLKGLLELGNGVKLVFKILLAGGDDDDDIKLLVDDTEDEAEDSDNIGHISS